MLLYTIVIVCSDGGRYYKVGQEFFRNDGCTFCECEIVNGALKLVCTDSWCVK